MFAFNVWVGRESRRNETIQCRRISQHGVLATLALGVSERYVLSMEVKIELTDVSVLLNLMILRTALRCSNVLLVLAVEIFLL